MAENRPPIRLVAADGTRLGVYADYTKNVKEAMPTASQDWVDVSILYVGKSTDEFTPGHLYTCEKNGDVYGWVDVTPIGEFTTILEQGFTTLDSTGTVVTFTKEELGVTDSYPEYDIIDASGYNISADTRVSRRWDKEKGVYKVAYLGGWPAGTWTLKSVGQAPMNLANYTYSKSKIEELISSADDKRIVEVSGIQAHIDVVEPDTYYICTGALESLEIGAVTLSAKESAVFFTSDTTACTVSLPASLQWMIEPTFSTGTSYVIIFNYGVAASAELEEL